MPLVPRGNTRFEGRVPRPEPLVEDPSDGGPILTREGADLDVDGRFDRRMFA